MSQRDIVNKADMTLAQLQASGGYLSPEQANRFIQLMLDEPTILNGARVVRMSGPVRKIDKIGFGSRILNVAPASGSYLESSKRVRPDLGQVTLTTKEFIAEVFLPYDVLEDNIERGNLEDTIMAMIAKRAVVDLEELLVKGDTSSTDEYLASMDGLLKQIVTNVATTTGAMSKAQLKKALKVLPAKYLRPRNAFRFYVSHSNETDFRDEVVDRDTALGDSALMTYPALSAYGIPVVPAASMPDSKIVLTHPQNVIFGIQRDIMIESDKDIRARGFIIVVTMRVDFKLEEETAAALVSGVGSTG